MFSHLLHPFGNADKAPVSAPAAENRALLIGINYFGTENELAGCFNDIVNCHAMLKAAGYTNFYVLCEEQPEMPSELAAARKGDPTYAAILAGFDWLSARGAAVAPQPQGQPLRLFLHYSGHGSYVADVSGDEADGRDECICPSDCATAGYILDDLMRTRLVDRLPAGARLTALFDSCHSGTILDLKYNMLADVSSRRKQTITMTADTHYRDSLADVVVFSGCMDSQTSADTYLANQNQGAMTYAFLSNLHHARTLGEMIRGLAVFMKSHGYSQSPRLSTGRQCLLDEAMRV